VTVRKEYTSSDRRTAIRYYKKGWGCLRISQIIGCYPSTIKRWIERAIEDGEPGLEKHPPPNYPEKMKRRIIAEYLKRTDLSLDKVAKKNHIGPHTLHRWLEAAGVTTRGTRPAMYDRDAILVDILAGMKKKDIAAKHKCSESWVYRVQSGKG